MAKALEDRIRERAYYLSINHGGAGDNNHFWLMAEREVLAEITGATVSAPVSATTAATDSATLTTPTVETAATIAAATPATAATAKPKKTAVRKLRSTAKSTAKPAAKPTVLTVVDGASGKSATVTPIRPAGKTSAKQAAIRARARAAAR